MQPGDIVRLEVIPEGKGHHWVPGLIETYGYGPHVVTLHGAPVESGKAILKTLDGELLRYPEGSQYRGDVIAFNCEDLELDAFLTSVHKRKLRKDKKSQRAGIT